MAEAEGLIETARTALDYKTAEGMSAAFSEQYKESKTWWKIIPWILDQSRLV